jgi:hypothetical protein
MVGKTWTTTEQEVFLRDRMALYRACMPGKKYQAFWSQVFSEWKASFPELPHPDLPGIEKDTDIVPKSEQEALYNSILDKRLDVSTHLEN